MSVDISDILFNLASADRLALLSAISLKKQRLTSLSKVINASAQECSRHLARLSETGFIQRNSEGFFETTSLGKIVLSLFPSLEFLFRHKDYFLTHDLSVIPRSYVERIGDLSGADHLNHLSLVLEHIKAVISKGREYVWLVSDKPIVVGTSIGTSFFSRDLPVRLIGEETTDRNILAETKSALRHSELAVLPEVKIAMAINETIAGVCFPGLNGRIDFGSGFSGKDPLFRTWCCDLFEYYWVRSRKSGLF